MNITKPSRRDVLKHAGVLAGVGLTARFDDGPAISAGRYKIGACDWSIGMRARTGALALARQLGLDGAQVSMGSVDSDLPLRQPEVQRAYREAAAANGVQVGGVARAVMNQ